MPSAAQTLSHGIALQVLSAAREHLKLAITLSCDPIDKEGNDALHILAQASRRVFDSYVKAAKSERGALKKSPIVQAA